MSVRVAINGFGRIGRAFLRSAHRSGADLDVVAVNDVADASTLAWLLARDTVYGAFPAPVHADHDAIVVDERRILVLSEREPSALPWASLDVDVVIEATGRFRTREGAAEHLTAGASKVIVSAPIKGDTPADADVVLGVNFDDVYDPALHAVITNASCTTNCLAPVAKVLNDAVGIRHGQMTTIHAYTADQNLLDGPHKDLRRARAAAENLVPTSTGAAKALGLVLPELAGRLNGIAVRVPVPTGSIVDLTVEAERATSAGEVNAAFEEAAFAGPLRGILDYREEPIVSSDIVGSPASAIFDAALTVGRRRHAGEGRRLVRQRVGLRDAPGRAGRARACAGHQRAGLTCGCWSPTRRPTGRARRSPAAWPRSPAVAATASTSSPSTTTRRSRRSATTRWSPPARSMPVATRPSWSAGCVRTTRRSTCGRGALSGVAQRRRGQRRGARGHARDDRPAAGRHRRDPGAHVAVAGALRYRHYDVATRILMRLIAGRHGQPTGPDTELEFTDWAALERFANAFLDAAAPTPSHPTPHRRFPHEGCCRHLVHRTARAPGRAGARAGPGPGPRPHRGERVCATPTSTPRAATGRSSRSRRSSPATRESAIIEPVGDGRRTPRGRRPGRDALAGLRLRDCEHCITGRETLCEAQQNTGYSIDGAYAEYAVGYAGYVVPVPDGVDPSTRLR